MLASVSTAGIPKVGIVTLAIILKQLNIPTDGIVLILGVDSLLDMVRTVVNIIGNAVITCVIAASENQLNRQAFEKIS